jgi:putative ABC transport system ATP-binding protein
MNKIYINLGDTMIDIKNLTKFYRTDDIETTALNNINIKINTGEFVSIMGPSGCGKSTLLNSLGLLDTPDSGTYLFIDEDVTKVNEKQRSQIRKENIGFIFQSFNLIDELTIFENVELPLIYLKVPKQERASRVNELLEKMEIMHRKDHFPSQLSGGQQQRVAIARAVVTKPKLLLADEPTGNLDSKNGKEVMQIISNLHKEGSTIIMVTHSDHDAHYSERVIRLLDGKVISENLVNSFSEV